MAHKIYQVPYKPGFLGDLVRIEIDQGSKLQFLLKVTEALTVICESFLNSTELQEELKGFDLIVYDSLAVCPAVMLGERFGIPRVEIVLHPNYPFAFNHMVPMPVSYVPQAFTGFSDKMTFVERVVNLGAYLEGVLNVAACFGTNLFNNIVYNRPVNPDALKAKYNITPERSFQEAVADAELVIFTADFALEYAQPLLPGKKKVPPWGEGIVRGCTCAYPARRGRMGEWRGWVGERVGYSLFQGGGIKQGKENYHLRIKKSI